MSTPLRGVQYGAYLDMSSCSRACDDFIHFCSWLRCPTFNWRCHIALPSRTLAPHPGSKETQIVFIHGTSPSSRSCQFPVHSPASKHRHGLWIPSTELQTVREAQWTKTFPAPGILYPLVSSARGSDKESTGRSCDWPTSRFRNNSCSSDSHVRREHFTEH